MDATPRHGEYKTPGGKLVVADFRIVDGALRDVEVSGDFFLYPEEALRPITAALEGAPAGMGTDELATRVASAMPAGTELLGSSPEGVAIAVRRAITPEPEER